MRVFHKVERETTETAGLLEQLKAGLEALHWSASGSVDLERLEGEAHGLFMMAERAYLTAKLEGLDVDVAQLLIDGQMHHRVLRSERVYTSAAGPLKVKRTLYRGGTAKAVVPLERRVGIVAGRFTPRAARQGLWVVAQLPPQEAASLFKELGGMSPSKSSLDRLPKAFGAEWEAHRESFEGQLRAHLEVPATAVTVAVSLDGVMTPMKDALRQAKREATFAAGKRKRGPAGHREVGCGTLSFYDGSGVRLSSVRMARMPEEKKATLKTMLEQDLAAVLAQRPSLHIVKVADGAKDNWRYLSETLPSGTEVLDFYHAAEHLKDALDAAYGENTPTARSRFETYRHILLEQPQGVEKVICALVYLRKCHPQRQVLSLAVSYFRRHRARMQYATVRAAGLPIGSGVVEAACKTLVTQRLKRSGMRWRHPGGQAILTLRSLLQSGRFDDGWKLIAQCYRSEISLPASVVPFPRAA